jgi:hypothetical protein
MDLFVDILFFVMQLYNNILYYLYKIRILNREKIIKFLYTDNLDLIWEFRYNSPLHINDILKVCKDGEIFIYKDNTYRIDGNIVYCNEIISSEYI